MLNGIARFVAISLSIAAGSISVLGLAAIFSGAYWYVIVVASLLEIAKVVTAAWLERNWITVSGKLKTYLVIATTVLMLITSLGIYGFFSRAHLEQQVQLSTGETSQIPLIQSKIDSQKSVAADLDKQISLIDNALSAMTEKGRASDARQALIEAAKQRKERDVLVAKKEEVVNKLIPLQAEKARLENVVKRNEVEVGPLKYIAAFFGDENSEATLEKAVRYLILVIVAVFDPLAIALLLASNHKQKRPTVKVLRTRNPVDGKKIAIYRAKGKTYYWTPKKKERKQAVLNITIPKFLRSNRKAS